MNVLKTRFSHYSEKVDFKTALVGIAVGAVFVALSWKLAFAVILGAMASIYLKDHPDKALLLTIAAIPFEMIGRVSSTDAAVPLSLSKILGVVTFIALMWNVLVARRKLFFPKAFILFAVFIIFAAVNYNYAIDSTKALTGLQRLVVTLFFYFLVIQLVDSKAMLKKSMWAISLSLVFSAATSIYQRFGSAHSYEEAVATYGKFYGSMVENLDMSSFLRTTGFYADPDIFAFALLIPTGFILLKLKNARSMAERLLLAVFLVAISGGIISSHSRTALIGLFVLVVLLMAFVVRPKPVFYLYLAIAGIALSPLLPSSYLERIRSIVDIKGSYTSTSRLIIYEDGFSMYRDNWLLGVGADNFPVNFENYTRSDIRPAGTMNLYLQVAAEYGTVGLVLFALIVWDAFRSFSAARRWLLARGDTEYCQLMLTVQLIMVSLLVCGLTIHTMERKEMWLIFALPVAALGIAREDKMKAAHKRQGSQKSENRV